MGRGRRPNLALEPTRALQTQRAFRQRKADHLAGLQDSINELTNENDRLRQLLHMKPSTEVDSFTKDYSEPSSSPSAVDISANGADGQTVKQQLAIAATHVEQQMARLGHTLKVLRSLIESKSTSSDALIGSPFPSSFKQLIADDDRRFIKKPKVAHEHTLGVDKASSSPATDRSTSTVNGVSITPKLQSTTAPLAATEGLSRHLPPPHMLSHNGSDNKGNITPQIQTSSAPMMTLTASWQSASAPAGSPAAYAGNMQISNGHQHQGHISQHATDRLPTTMSSTDLPSHLPPRHYTQSPPQYSAQPQHAFRTSYPASASPHNSMKAELWSQHPHSQQQVHRASPLQSYSTSAGANNSPSYSATRSLTMQALNSPHGQQGHATDECAAGPSPSSNSLAYPSVEYNGNLSYRPESTIPATSKADSIAMTSRTDSCGRGCGPESKSSESNETDGKKACCPPPLAQKADPSAPPLLGISVNMKTETPNGEPCCFGLLDCDEQGRIIL